LIGQVVNLTTAFSESKFCCADIRRTIPIRRLLTDNKKKTHRPEGRWRRRLACSSGTPSLCVRRVVQDDGRGEYGPRALSRLVDSGGHAVMLQRLDGSHLAAIGIAEGKARTAVEFRRPTKAARTRSIGSRSRARGSSLIFAARSSFVAQ
jgi:hypothetical protein